MRQAYKAIKPIIKKARRKNNLDVSWEVAFVLGLFTATRTVSNYGKDVCEACEVNIFADDLRKQSIEYLKSLGIEVKENDA